MYLYIHVYEQLAHSCKSTYCSLYTHIPVFVYVCVYALPAKGLLAARRPRASKQARHREKMAEMCCGKLQHFWVCKGYVLLANNSLSAKKPCQQFGNHRGPRFACTLCSLRRLHGCSSDRIELLLLEQCQWKTTTKPLCSCMSCSSARHREVLSARDCICLIQKTE